MVKIKKGYILLTCFTSGIAAILSLASLGTEQWIVGEGQFINENDRINVKYGLFSGILRQKLLSVITYEIKMICNYKENACAVLCKNTAEGAQKELQDLINGQNIRFQCSSVPRSSRGGLSHYGPQKPKSEDGDRTFINAGVYMSTLVSLVIAAGFGVFATILSVLNTGGNPIRAYFNILGLYIYNGLATFFSFLVLCIWGTEYSVKLIDQVAILYTIVGEADTTGGVTLGFSYWLNIGSMVLYGTSIFSLWYRQYTIEREPEVKVDIEDVDDNIILY